MAMESKYTSPRPAERGPGAGGECDPDAQRDRQVHAHASQAQIAPGRLEERPGRIDHHRQRKDQAGPAHQLLDVGRHAAGLGQIDRQRIHHHLHHAESGNKQAPQAVLALRAPRGFLLARVVRMRAIADAPYRGENFAQVLFARVPAQLRAVRRGVDADAKNARQALEHALVEPHACGAAYAFDHERGIAFAARGQCGRSRAELRDRRKCANPRSSPLRSAVDAGLVRCS